MAASFSAYACSTCVTFYKSESLQSKELEIRIVLATSNEAVEDVGLVGQGEHKNSQ
jgi:hypothetical protein